VKENLEMLEQLTATHFAALQGETFELQLEGAEPLPLVLVEVTEGATDPRRPAPRRTSFSITFRGPATPHLPQQIYSIEHPKLGALEIFIVPIRRDAQGLYYEAVFG
jgi:hypothetical protein